MDVGVAPKWLAERFEVGAASEGVGVAGIVVLAASDAHDEKDHTENTGQATGHRAKVSEAADIAIDGLDIDFAPKDEARRALHEHGIARGADGDHQRSPG